MAEGFKLAEAYVEVHLQDNTEADEKRIRTRIERSGAVTIKTVLDDPQGLERVKERIRRSSPTKLSLQADNPIDEAWRAKVKASLKATANDALKIPATADGEKFKRDLAAVIKEVETGLEADIPVDVRDAAKFKREVELLAKLAGEETKVRIPVEVDEGAVSNSAAKAKGKLQALLFTALSVGLPAAAAIGAAGVVASLALVPAAFTALGAFALKSNANVRESFGSLKTSVVDDTKSMAAVLAGPLQQASADLQSSFNRLRPEIQLAFAGTAPLVKDLTGSVTDFAEGAMPGMVTAINNGEDAMRGFRSFTGQVGQGLSDMFTNMSHGSADAGQSMQTLGGVTRDLLGFIGTLTANLSAAHGPLASLQGGLREAESAITSLTSSGGAATSFLSGFTNTAMGAVGALNGVAGLLNALPSGLVQFGGSLLSAAMIAKRFGVDATSGFDGLVGRIKEAEGAGSKLGTAIGGLIGGALNPASLAVLGLGFLLQELGQRQAEAAAKAQEHAQNVQSLTAALEADEGAVGAATQRTVAKALADKNASGNAAALGVSMGTVEEAALGNGSALEELTGRTNSLIDSYVAQGKIGSQNVWMLKNHVKALAENGGAASDAAHDYGDLSEAERAQIDAGLNLIGVVGEQARSLKKAQDDARNLKSALSGVSVEQLKLNEASTIGQAAAGNLAAAFKALAKAGGDVQSKGQALIAVFDALHGSQLTAEDAMQAWNDQMRTATDLLKGLDLGAKNKDFIDSAGAINTASEAGSKFQNFIQDAAVHMAAYAQSLKDQGASTDEITKKLAPMEDQLTKQLKAWGLTDQQIQQILQHYGAIPSEITTTLKVSGGEASKIQVQTILEEVMKLPPEKGVHVTTLTEEAKQNLIDLGYQIVQLPDGTFQVFSNTQPAKDGATQLKNLIDHTEGTVQVFSNSTSATGTVTQWQQRTDGTVGMTTTDTRIDPATHKVQAWMVQANGTWGWTNLNSRTDPANGKLQVWVQTANGTWAWVNADAHTGAAESALNYAARDRTSVIHQIVVGTPGGGGNSASLVGRPVMNAAGNVLSPRPALAYAAGGFADAQPMSGRDAVVVPPDTLRVIGDNMRFSEAFIPLDRGSARAQSILDYANQEMGRSAPRVPAMSGASTVNHHWNIVINGADKPAPMLAAQVANEVSWRLKS